MPHQPPTTSVRRASPTDIRRITDIWHAGRHDAGLECRADTDVGDLPRPKRRYERELPSGTRRDGAAR